MPGRALLIGVAVDGLSGVENDVAAMAEALRARGLTVEPPLTGKAATRAGILAAYERLIAEVAPGECAVVYYSGHGGRVLPPSPGAAGPELMDLQFIVPFDFHDSGPDDFRGITSVELSVLQARLTERTDNVVTVFDCCHSGRISRGEPRPKALPRATPYERLRAHVERLRETEGLRTDLLNPNGNPDAVRIVACAPEQPAFEYPGAGGRQIGILTEALTMALRAAETEPVSWASLLDGIRYRVSSLVAGQRPEVEGPAHRVLFTTRQNDRLDSLPATAVGGGRVSLQGAALLGVRPGDTFTVWSPSGDRIGEVTVERVGPLAAQGPVALAPGITRVPVGARAHAVATTAPTLAVSVPADYPRVADLVRAVARAPLLRVAGENEPWSVQVRIDADGTVASADRLGLLRDPRPLSDTGIAETVGDLTKLARAAALRGLTSDTRWSLNARVAYEWGLVRDGARHRLPDAGARIRAGEAMFISVRNENNAPVYVTLVDIGASGRVTVLTNFAPSGVRLTPGERDEYVYGFDDFSGALEGIAVEWPDGLDPAYARPETVLLFVTSEPQDFSALAQDGIAVARPEPGSASPLSAVLQQIASGRPRELRPASGAAGRYDVRALEFELEPADGRAGFLLEEDLTAPTALAARDSRPPRTPQ